MAPAPVLHGRQRRFLRAQAHALKVALQLGNAGLTDNVVAETRQLLGKFAQIQDKLQAPFLISYAPKSAATVTRCLAGSSGSKAASE